MKVTFALLPSTAGVVPATTTSNLVETKAWTFCVRRSRRSGFVQGMRAWASRLVCANTSMSSDVRARTVATNRVWRWFRNFERLRIYPRPHHSTRANSP